MKPSLLDGPPLICRVPSRHQDPPTWVSRLLWSWYRTLGDCFEGKPTGIPLGNLKTNRNSNMLQVDATMLQVPPFLEKHSLASGQVSEWLAASLIPDLGHCQQDELGRIPKCANWSRCFQEKSSWICLALRWLSLWQQPEPGYKLEKDTPLLVVSE